MVAIAPEAASSTNPGSISVSASDGAGNSTTPGRSCADGGAGASWHYDYGAKLAANSFSKLDSEARVHLDLHSDTQRYTNASGAYLPGTTAFLQGNESHLSILNQRGSVKVRLRSGDCGAPSLNFNGSFANGAGTWALDSGTGAYRGVTSAGGGFALNTAEVNPGADNALSVALSGTFTVPDPSLKLEVVKTYWGSVGTDYLTRRVTVLFKVTNNGPGDAFGATFQSHGSQTLGVVPMGPVPQPLFDLPAGASQTVKVRYQFGLFGPCFLILFACNFQASATVNMPDAFDIPHVMSATVPAKAPSLPPPL